MALSEEQIAWLAKLGINVPQTAAPAARTGMSADLTGRKGAGSHDLLLTPVPGAQASPTAPGTGGAPGGPPQKGKPTVPTAAEIRAAQQAINKWRVANGDSPINETGVLDPDTNSAITDFQHDTGLDPFQLGTPAAKGKLSLLLRILKVRPNSIGSRKLSEFTGNANFRSLGEPLQTKVLERIESYAGDIKKLDNIRLVEDVVMENGFDQLPGPNQKLVLDTLAARADDAALSSNLGQLVGSSGFRNLPEKTQTWVLKRIKKYGGDRTKIDNLENLITATMNFDTLSKANQDQMLLEIAANAEDTELVNNLSLAVQGNLMLVAAGVDFRALDPTMQMEVLNRVRDYPRDPINVENLMLLVATSGFGDLGFEVQDQILKDLPGRYGSVRLDAAMISNMMTLVTASGFENVRREFSVIMLDLLSVRPGNAQLATAFRELVESGALHDRRTARHKILDVDDKTQ